MIKRLLTLVFLTGALSANLHAQTPGEEELGAWFMYFGTNQIAERFSIHSEAQFRYYETTDNFNQMLLRTGLNYHINPDAMATIGYAFIQTDSSLNIVTVWNSAFLTLGMLRIPSIGHAIGYRLPFR